MLCLLRLLVLFLLLSHDNHITLARQTLSGRLPRPPIVAASNNSAASPLTQANSSAYVIPSPVGVYNSSHGIINAPPPMPTLVDQKSANNNQDIRSGFCAIGDDFCSFKDSNGTIVEATATNFSDQCLLWDPSCSGNRTLAVQKFFDNAFGDGDLNVNIPNEDALKRNGKIIDNDCFLQNNAVNQSDCDRYNPPDRLSNFEKIKKWMRSQQCVSAAKEWLAMTGTAWQVVFGGREPPDLGLIAESEDADDNPESNSPSCCGTCNVFAKNVDLYYWPEPDADQSCLGIIGNSSRPLEYGATTAVDYGSTKIYWGCNTTSIGMIEGEPGVSTTITYVLTTAEITTIGSLTVKVSSISPWSSSPCLEDDAGVQRSNQSINVRNGYASVYARDHSLIVPSSITQAEGLPVSTIVSGDFTL